jgi:predicted Zn-dependent protease
VLHKNKKKREVTTKQRLHMPASTNTNGSSLFEVRVMNEFMQSPGRLLGLSAEEHAAGLV